MPALGFTDGTGPSRVTEAGITPHDDASCRGARRRCRTPHHRIAAGAAEATRVALTGPGPVDVFLFTRQRDLPGGEGRERLGRGGAALRGGRRRPWRREPEFSRWAAVG